MATIQRSAARIVRHNVTLDDGRVVALFVNLDSRLVVLDVVDADENGGVEVYRAVQPIACGATTPSECAAMRERSVAGISDEIPACPVHGTWTDHA